MDLRSRRRLTRTQNDFLRAHHAIAVQIIHTLYGVGSLLGKFLVLTGTSIWYFDEVGAKSELMGG